jgi:hypothetical protein
MKYYYLDGIEKKGPYTLEEIRSRNLSSDTMIYREDKTNWLALSEFEELNPSETIESDDIIIPLVDEANVDEKDTIGSDEVKIKLPKHTILILLIVASIGISALITYFQQKNDYKKINEELNTLFKGKSTISDYILDDELYGQLYDVVYHAAGTKDPIFGKDNFVAAGNIRLATEPYRDASKTAYWNNKEIKNWELYKNLKQYYIRGGYTMDGFLALQLSRNGNIFTVIDFLGGDMAYKVPEKIFKSGTDFGSFSTPGFDIPSNRPSIKKCYKEAVVFLTKVDRDSSNYIPGSYSKILGFRLAPYNYFKNDFYEINQVGDEYFNLAGDTIHVRSPNGEKSYVIDNNKITSNTSRYDPCVFNSDWIVWYKSYSNSYSLEQKKWAFLIYFSIYSVIGIILSIIIYFIMKNRKRIVIE